MALYVGSSKHKLIVGKALQSLNIYTKPKTLIKALLSSDNYILKDKNDTYLITKDGE
jgi:hypothetical protein